MGKSQSKANSQVAPPEEAKLDESLENGPIDKRSCRDILCCLLFIFACVVGVALAIYGWGKGDPKRLITPYDYDAQGCGYSAGLEEYKYLYYTLPYPGYLDHTICVKTCPRTDISLTDIDCKNNSLYQYNSKGKCSMMPDFEVSGVDWSKPYQVIAKVQSLANITNNLMIVYNSTPMPYFGRICIPAFNMTTLQAAAAANASINANVDASFNASESTTYSSNSTILNTMGSVLRWADDVKTCWWVILIVGGIAILVGFVYLIVLRYCVGCLIWVGILLYFLICGLLCYFAYAQQKKYDAYAKEANVSNNSVTWVTVFKYFIWIWTAASVLVLCCMYHRIQLAIAVMKTASNFMGDVKSALIVPFITLAMLICFWVFWIPGFVYIWSDGEAPNTYDVRTSLTPFPGVRWTGNVPYFIIYFLGWGLWCNAFINAIGQFVLACAVCLWYFSQGAGQGVHKPISRGFYYCFRYHWGSLAFGSLILAIVQLVRIILLYIQKQMKNTKAGENKFIQALFCIVNCYMACLERFIKMINKNAYIQIALQGKNFCLAAKDAIMVLLKNPLRFTAVNGFGRIFIMLGKFFICIGSTTIGYIIMRYYSGLNNKISSVIAPGIIMGLISYFMGQLFMQVYGMAISAILHCFVLDEEIGKQKGRQAKFTPPLLQSFLSKYEKKVDAAKK